MMDDVLGYDCDNNPLYEFEIIRPIWYSDIDFSKETNINPRQYCVFKAPNGKVYLVSVYDHWEKRAINLFEGRKLEDDVPIKILPISEACHYEKAIDCYGNICTYYVREKEQKRLVREINSDQNK